VLEEANHAWMPVERKMFEQALELELPLLGICFGSQMLASAAGAQVYKVETPEVGWTKVDMLPNAANDPVMAAIGSNPRRRSRHRMPGARLRRNARPRNQPLAPVLAAACICANSLNAN